MQVTKNGEIKIKFNKKTFTLIPTFKVLCAIEDELNKSIIDITNSLANNTLRLQEVITIMSHGIKSSDEQLLDADTLGELMLSSGLAETMQIVAKFLELGLGA